MYPKLDKLNQKLYNPILNKEKISFGEIRKACKKFSVKGDSRNSLFFPKNFYFKRRGNNLTLTFDLKPGEYGTQVLDFLFENQGKIKHKLN